MHVCLAMIADNINIQCARPPLHAALAAKRRLQRVQTAQQADSGRHTAHRHHCIDIVMLRLPLDFGADRQRAIKRCPAHKLRPGQRQIGNRCLDQLSAIGESAAHIAAQSEINHPLGIAALAADGKAVSCVCGLFDQNGKARIMPRMNELAPLPDKNCQICPRLAAYRDETRAAEPDWFNAPVPCFGDPDAELLIVGLAPGVTGANRTGRPFTGDWAGDLLYATLDKFGFSEGTYNKQINDGLRLKNCMITNAVRCVPPQNKPVGAEINNCRPYLAARLASLPRLKIVLSLGKISHDSVLRAANVKLKDAPFGHAVCYQLPGFTLMSSYHCSRYNTNTGRLTTEMFEAVFGDVREILR